MTETPDTTDTDTDEGRVAGNAETLQKIGDEYRAGAGQPADAGDAESAPEPAPAE